MAKTMSARSQGNDPVLWVSPYLNRLIVCYPCFGPRLREMAACGRKISKMPSRQLNKKTKIFYRGYNTIRISQTAVKEYDTQRGDVGERLFFCRGDVNTNKLTALCPDAVKSVLPTENRNKNLPSTG